MFLHGFLQDGYAALGKKIMKSGYRYLALKIRYYVYCLSWRDVSEELWLFIRCFWRAVGLLLGRDLVELWSPPPCAPGLWCVRCLCARYAYFVLEPIFSWSYNVCGGNHLCQYRICGVSQTTTYTRNSWNSRHFGWWVSSALVIR